MDATKDQAEDKIFSRNFVKFSDEDNDGSHHILNAIPFGSIAFLGGFLLYKLFYHLYCWILKKEDQKRITRTQISEYKYRVIVKPRKRLSCRS